MFLVVMRNAVQIWLKLLIVLDYFTIAMIHCSAFAVQCDVSLLAVNLC